MVQIYATLLFLLIAAAGMTVIVASLIDDWAVMMRALGLAGTDGIAPLPQGRLAGARQQCAIRVSRRPEARRAAA